MKLHQELVVIDGTVSAIDIEDRANMNFVNVFQNQLLFRKLLMMGLTLLKALMWPADIQYCMNICMGA